MRSRSEPRGVCFRIGAVSACQDFLNPHVQQSDRFGEGLAEKAEQLVFRINLRYASRLLLAGLPPSPKETPIWIASQANQKIEVARLSLTINIARFCSPKTA